MCFAAVLLVAWVKADAVSCNTSSLRASCFGVVCARAEQHISTKHFDMEVDLHFFLKHKFWNARVVYFLLLPSYHLGRVAGGRRQQACPLVQKFRLGACPRESLHAWASSRKIGMEVGRISLQTLCPQFVVAVALVTLALKRKHDLLHRFSCKLCAASVSSLGLADICQTRWQGIGTKREHG